MAETKTVNGVTLEKLVSTEYDCCDCSAENLDPVDDQCCGGFCDNECCHHHVWQPVSIVPQAKPASVVKQGTRLNVYSSEFGDLWGVVYLDDSPGVLELAKRHLDAGFGTREAGKFKYVEHEGKTYLLGPEITLNEGLQEVIEQKAIARQAESKLSEEEKQALKQMWGLVNE